MLISANLLISAFWTLILFFASKLRIRWLICCVYADCCRIDSSSFIICVCLLFVTVFLLALCWPGLETVIEQITMLMMIMLTSVIGDAWSNTTRQFIWLCRVATGRQNTSMLYVTMRLSVTVSHTTLLLVSVLSLSGTSGSCPVNFHSLYLLVLRLFLDIFVLIMYAHCPLFAGMSWNCRPV